MRREVGELSKDGRREKAIEGDGSFLLGDLGELEEDVLAELRREHSRHPLWSEHGHAHDVAGEQLERVDLAGGGVAAGEALELIEAVDGHRCVAVEMELWRVEGGEGVKDEEGEVGGVEDVVPERRREKVMEGVRKRWEVMGGDGR